MQVVRELCHRHTALIPGIVLNLEQGARGCLDGPENTPGSRCQRTESRGAGRGKPLPSTYALQSKAKAGLHTGGRRLCQNGPCLSSPGTWH